MSELLYIAAPFRAKTEAEVMQNIIAASEVWQQLADAGIDALCPHIQSLVLDPRNTRGSEWWLAHTLRLMQGCTGVVMCCPPGRSEGVDGEAFDAAGKMPIYAGVEVAIDCLGVRT